MVQVARLFVPASSLRAAVGPLVFGLAVRKANSAPAAGDYTPTCWFVFQSQMPCGRRQAIQRCTCARGPAGGACLTSTQHQATRTPQSKKDTPVSIFIPQASLITFNVADELAAADFVLPSSQDHRDPEIRIKIVQTITKRCADCACMLRCSPCS